MPLPTDESIAARIKSECNTGDVECDHSRADDILTELLRALGYNDTVNTYGCVEKWYA